MGEIFKLMSVAERERERERHDPKAGLASLNGAVNGLRLVLGCSEADFIEKICYQNLRTS